MFYSFVFSPYPTPFFPLFYYFFSICVIKEKNILCSCLKYDKISYLAAQILYVCCLSVVDIILLLDPYLKTIRFIGNQKHIQNCDTDITVQTMLNKINSIILECCARLADVVGSIFSPFLKYEYPIQSD